MEEEEELDLTELDVDQIIAILGAVTGQESTTN